MSENLVNVCIINVVISNIQRDTLRSNTAVMPISFCHLKIRICWDRFRSNSNYMTWTHFPWYWPFVWGSHWWPVNSPHKGQWRGALMFSFICAWIKAWVNNLEASDLRRHHGHYDVIVTSTFIRETVTHCSHYTWIFVSILQFFKKLLIYFKIQKVVPNPINNQTP